MENTVASITLNKSEEITKVDYFELDKLIMDKLTGNEGKVYRCLLMHKNNSQDYSFPSQCLIAEETKLNIKTVQRLIKTLVNKGFIAIKKMKKIIGHYNKYKLLYVACMDVVRAKKAKKQCNNVDMFENGIESTLDYKENKESNVAKILEFTKIKKITDKQKASIKEFDIITINQTIARIKSGITKMPRTATLLISKICDTAIGLGTLKDWQYKKYKEYKLLKPINHKEISMEKSVIEEKNDSDFEDLIGWDY